MEPLIFLIFFQCHTIVVGFGLSLAWSCSLGVTLCLLTPWSNRSTGMEILSYPKPVERAGSKKGVRSSNLGARPAGTVL